MAMRIWYQGSSTDFRPKDTKEECHVRFARFRILLRSYQKNIETAATNTQRTLNGN